MNKLVLVTRSVFLGLMFFSTFLLNAQDDVILKAMQDEMDRSMNELQLEDHEKPFFISYTLNDGRSFTAMASWGALVNSMEIPSRNTSVRVLVGDYDFNDESFSSSNNYPSYSDDVGGEMGMLNMLPIDNDYYGIRAVLWQSTNDIYKNAAKTFKEHQKTVEEKEQPLSEIPHKRFSKVPKQVYHEELKTVNFNKTEVEEYTRKISAIFLKYPKLVNSNVNLTLYTNRNYFLNTEGTSIITNHAGAELSLSATYKDEDGKFRVDRLNITEDYFGELPSIKDMEAKVKEMYEKLGKRNELEAFDDIYEGPVLFVGEAAGDVISRNLVSYFSQSNEYYGGSNRRAQNNKIGKRVSSRNLSVMALPTLKSWKGEEINSTNLYDREGVKTVDSLQLLDKGVLMNKVNSRTVDNDSTPVYGLASGLGVLSVSSEKVLSEEQLKEELMILAEDEGFEYAIMIREKQNLGSPGLEVVKIDIESKSEEVLNSAMLRGMNFNSFRKLYAASEDLMMDQAFEGWNGTGLHIIHPRMILIEDVEVDSQSNNNSRFVQTDKPKPSVVTRPLLRDQKD